MNNNIFLIKTQKACNNCFLSRVEKKKKKKKFESLKLKKKPKKKKGN